MFMSRLEPPEVLGVEVCPVRGLAGEGGRDQAQEGDHCQCAHARHLPISTDIYGNISEYLDAGTLVWRNCGLVSALCLLYSSHLQQEQRNILALTSAGSPDRRQ